jgi:MFS family permease
VNDPAAHPLRWTTTVLGVCAAVAAPMFLTLGEFVTFFLAGAFVGGAHSALLWIVSEHRDRVTAAVAARVAGGAAAGAVVAVIGGCLVPVIGVWGAAVFLALVLTAPYLARELGTARRRPHRPLAAAAGAPALPAPPLHIFSLSEITAAWAASHDALRRSASPTDRSRIAALRQAYLDELEKRDAAGLQRWLESGRALTSDPAGFLRTSGQDGPEPGAR